MSSRADRSFCPPSYDNQPALTVVPLRDDDGPTGAMVLAELEELDTLFTAALVVSF